MKRVVVTGIGAVTPIGNTFKTSWESAKAGCSGIGPISRFDASGLPWKLAGELKGFDERSFFGQKELRRLDLFVRYAVAAALMAAGDAGLADIRLPAGGVIIGSSRGGISAIEALFRKRGPSGRLRPSPYLMPATTISMAPSYISERLGIRGYCLGISNACASGTNAVGEAFRLLREGFAGPFLAGGAEAPICQACTEGYGVSGALSRGSGPSASRPFDLDRDGFVLSEGACVLVLEGLEEALNRKARIYGEIIGYACGTDAFHQTRPDFMGEARTISSAISDAQLKPGDIDYINTHGTSTVLGDLAEARALGEVFQERSSTIPASAVKSMTGHMLAASGALETAFTLMSIREGVIPPSINVARKDPFCALSLTSESRSARIGAALSNSFGFGGVNAALVLRKLPEEK